MADRHGAGATTLVKRVRPASNGSNGSPEAPPRTGGRRSGARRLSREHWLALVAGMVAFVLILAALRDRTETVTVVVARESIPAATQITPGMVRTVELPADSPVSASMVRLDDLSNNERFTTRAVAEGEPLTAQALVSDVPGDGLRSMSLPVPREHATGGALRAGDRADVLGVTDTGEVDYVVSGVEVLAVQSEESGGVGSRPSGFSVTVAVDEDQARRLAQSLATGDIEVVRSTGAEPAAETAGS